MWADASRGDDRSTIHIPLEAIQADSKARGDVYFDIRPASNVNGVAIPAHAELRLKVAKLAGNTTYRLRANGVNRATFTTKAKGVAKVTYSVLTGAGTQPVLDFDPRGMLISVADLSGTDLVSGVLYGPLEPPTTVFEEKVDLAPAGAAAGATATASYRTAKKGARTLDVQVKDLAEGDYGVRINGVPQGTLSVTRQKKHTSGKLTLDSRANKKKAGALSVDPRDSQLVLVGSGGGTVFSGVMRAAIPGGGPPPSSVDTVSLTLRIPDYETSQVAGLNIWRLQGSKYQQVERVLIWPPRMIGGSEVVDYSFLALESNTVTSGKFVAPVQRSGAGDAVTFTLDFDRPAPAAFFKISTFNGAGESPRSQNALRR